ncbi:hypothetical protein DSLASN_07860 [Desulfoluna limicola]|uniref:HDOD domain-containing protein n=1 Tax=Desulfoluna limicola TaxID=2810562 RepID=A0ABM7PDA2_9BACT|nr:HDOD domain-containing protein [Desulfoluna limicola]BCS95154.1 hypothetical protein DSLASN_07860 [Desulfoluna limicola]
MRGAKSPRPKACFRRPGGDPLAPFVLAKEEVVSNLKTHALFKARSLLTGHGNVRELEEILNTDPALAGRVLKVANSAHNGMSGKVSALQTTATVLGRDPLLRIIPPPTPAPTASPTSSTWPATWPWPLPGQKQGPRRVYQSPWRFTSSQRPTLRICF